MNAGHHKARALEWKLGRAGTGTPQIGVNFKLESGEEIAWYGSLSEKAFDRTVESLRHCGWEGDDLASITGLDKNEVSLDIGPDEYRGVVTLKVNWVNRIGGGVAMREELAGDELRAFAAQMKSRCAAVGKVPTRKPTQPEPARGPARQERPEDFGIPTGKDDLPF